MFSLRAHAIICAALFGALIGIALAGNALQAAGVIHDLGRFKLPFLILIFGLFLAAGFSAVPVMVKLFAAPALPSMVTVWPAQMVTLSAAPGATAAATPLHATVDQVAAVVQVLLAREK